MSNFDDSDIINFIHSFYKRDIKAINRNEYVQKLITHLKQEIPHLKRICTDEVTELISNGKIRLESRSHDKHTSRNSRRKHLSLSQLNTTRSTQKGEFVENQAINGDTQTPNIDGHPSLNFSSLAIKDETKNLIERIISCVKKRKIFINSNLTPCIGAIIYGFPGSGKTQFAKAIAGEYNYSLICVNGIDIVSDFKTSSEEKVKKIFENLQVTNLLNQNNLPAMLLIDDLDSAFSGQNDQSSVSRIEERRLSAHICQWMDKLANQELEVLVIATVSSISSIDSSLRRPGRFEYEINIPMPDEKMRLEILRLTCRQLNLNSDVDLQAISRNTPGFIAGDLVACVREAVLHSFNTYPNLSDSQSILTDISESTYQNKPGISQKDLIEAVKLMEPTCTREGFSTVQDVMWKDVGGMDKVKNYLSLAITAPITHPSLFASLGLRASTGILLVGPPGCGKTMVAKAVAHVDGLNFISVRGPELLSSYVGESERAVRNLFSRAQIAEPCVIFFDELDSLCPKRSDDPNNNYSSRLVNQLLTEMDGVLNRNRVFIIGATNRPDIIDPAILRKGRFDSIFYVGLPSQSERLSILQTLTKNGTCPLLASDVDLKEISLDQRCSRFSGADLADLIRQASMIALNDYLFQGIQIENADLSVNASHIEQALCNLKPSISDLDMKHYEMLKKKYD